MTTKIKDYARLRREAIAEARAAGLDGEAFKLEQAAFAAAFTTSSEMLQEHGLAIERFLIATKGALPRSTGAKLKVCLSQTEMAASGPGKLMALLKRRPARSGRSG